MEERKVVEKRTEVEHVERQEPVTPGVRNVNIGGDGSTQIQDEVVDDPVGSTTVHEETEVEEHSEP
jgi:hypothetical protein